MLGITKSDTKYRKRDKYVCGIDTVKPHFTDARLEVLGDKDEVPISSENVELHAPKVFHPRISALLRKHEHL